MRVVLDTDDELVGREPDDADLARLYAYPEGRTWLRANMVSTLDGAATGPDGKTGTINNDADRQVFMLLRALADAVVVGAGTARVEGYGRPRPVRGARASLRSGRPAAPALVVVSRSANLPTKLTLPAEDDGSGEVFLVTCTAAGDRALDAARAVLGEDHVLVADGDTVDLPAMVAHLHALGMTRLLTEGGPHLLRDLTAAGLVDEICLTVVPHVLGGRHPRILAGAEVSQEMRPRLLLEADGTLLGRWSRP